jgi:lipopolysaccharide cholinephosphotransferase
LQLQLFDMLLAIKGVLDPEARFFLAAGTALGACREGDIIAWDNDLDLLVPVDSYQKTIDLLRRRLPYPYMISEPGSPAQFPHLFARVHLIDINQKYVHADLFPLGRTYSSQKMQRVHLLVSKRLRDIYYRMHRLSDLLESRGRSTLGHFVRRQSSLCLRAFRLLCVAPLAKGDMVTNVAAGYLERECFPATVFSESAGARVRGELFPVPAEWDTYLTGLYGDYATPPAPGVRQAEIARFDSWCGEVLRGLPVRLARYNQGTQT